MKAARGNPSRLFFAGIAGHCGYRLSLLLHNAPFICCFAQLSRSRRSVVESSSRREWRSHHPGLVRREPLKPSPDRRLDVLRTEPSADTTTRRRHDVTTSRRSKNYFGVESSSRREWRIQHRGLVRRESPKAITRQRADALRMEPSANTTTRRRDVTTL